ncbi:DUF3040 domain-containing protein [Lentzea sp. NPDC034063]|uniref:DUF3040 domain-containing protein n=1 Tax=unclassified Lentzea TaxID=2643253 RepID=UPI00340C2422
MGLAEHEKRELDAIAHHLKEDDPQFVTKLSKPSWHVRLSGNALFVLGLLSTYLVGLTMVVTGVTMSLWPLLVAGAVVTAIYPAKTIIGQLRKKRPS